MDGFATHLWSKLTVDERLEHCRQAAQEAERCAVRANPHIRNVYRDLADEWQKLAHEMQRTLKL